jgi:hypothetical protein
MSGQPIPVVVDRKPTDVETQFFRDPSNPSLIEITNLLRAFDEGVIAFDPEVHLKTLGRGMVKIDNYHRFIQSLDAETAIVDQKIEDLNKWRKTLQSRKRGIENLLLYLAKNNQLLPGENYQPKVKASTTTVAKVPPSEDLFFAFPDLVRTKLEWKMNEVKKHLNENPDSEIAPLIAFETTEKIVFELRKGIAL